jgi:hypothetical protein
LNELSAIAKLSALEEITLLKARRDRAADTNDWVLYESLHAPDHRSENGDYGTRYSAAEMVENVRKSMANLITMHHSHTPEIEFESLTNARGIWAMTGLSLWMQGEEQHWFRAFGHYFEPYENRGDRWLFTSRRLEYYHTARSPGAVFPPKLEDQTAKSALDRR